MAQQFTEKLEQNAGKLQTTLREVGGLRDLLDRVSNLAWRFRELVDKNDQLLKERNGLRDENIALRAAFVKLHGEEALEKVGE